MISQSRLFQPHDEGQMMNKSVLQSIVLSTFLLIPCALLAASSDSAPIYDIELILFSQPGGSQGEDWPENADVPNLLLSRGILSSEERQPTVALLQKEKIQLAASAYTLERKGYHVLLHTAWRQPVHSRSNEDWLLIEKNNLHGMVKMVKGRYLHFYTDLRLVSADTGQPYQIKLHRRMRSDELHYVDHPIVGALVQAKRYEPPVVEPPAQKTPLQ